MLAPALSVSQVSPILLTDKGRNRVLLSTFHATLCDCVCFFQILIQRCRTVGKGRSAEGHGFQTIQHRLFHVIVDGRLLHFTLHSQGFCHGNTGFCNFQLPEKLFSIDSHDLHLNLPSLGFALFGRVKKFVLFSI